MADSAPKEKPTVLVVDDEPAVCERLTEVLHDEGYQTVTAHNGEEARRARVAHSPDVILLDIWMPDIDGISLMREWKEQGLAGPAIIVMSGHATISTAVEATKFGASNFLEKPISGEELVSTVSRATQSSVKPLFNPVIQEINLGRSKAMRALKEDLLKASAVSTNLLVLAPQDDGASFFAGLLTPPGKDMEVIHGGAQLAQDPMDALKRVRGGLIYLPNIDLLGGVELRGAYLLASKSAQTRTRIVAHTNVEPEALRARADFDAQLLEEFGGEPLRIPPFSDFSSDIPELSVVISKRLVMSSEASPRRLSSGAVNALVNHKWTDGLGQLIGAIRSAMQFATSEEVDEMVVRSVLSQTRVESGEVGIDRSIYDLPLRDARDVFEREYFRRLLLSSGGSIIDAAQKAGLERTYLYRKLKHLELDGIEIH